MGTHFQIFPHRHVSKYLSTFRTHRDSAANDDVSRHSVDSLAIEKDLPAANRIQATNTFQGCAFAGAVGANEGDAFALRHM